MVIQIILSLNWASKPQPETTICLFKIKQQLSSEDVGAEMKEVTSFISALSVKEQSPCLLQPNNQAKVKYN